LPKKQVFSKQYFFQLRTLAKMSEVDAAAKALSTDPAINPSAPTFFDKIVSKEIPAQVR
jgi:hypothetical protein